MNLPDYPIGDIDEYSTIADELGDIDIGDSELGDELGSPSESGHASGAVLANVLAHKAPHHAAHVIKHVERTHGHKVAHKLRMHTLVKHLSENRSCKYERIQGGRIISSTLKEGAVMHPTEVQALKQAIYGSVPFQPRTFPFVPSGPDLIVDLRTALNSVVGPNNDLYYAGYIVTLQASVFNTNMGAFINMIRNLGAAPGNLNVTQLIELDSGAKAVQVLNLNGQIIAGHPRFWAPKITSSAVADPNTEVRLQNLPANYTANLRFLQPGDQQVNFLLSQL
jgi:hypothetical protein